MANFWQKILEMLQSRKFWALILALAVTWLTFSQGGIPLSQAINDTVAAIMAYVAALGIQDAGKAMSKK
jgi:hypothetical protein